MSRPEGKVGDKRRSRSRRPKNRSRGKREVTEASQTLNRIWRRPKEQALEDWERAVLKRHLVFFKKFRGHLKLKYNAAEDLWVNGVKEPEDRGGCKHLFSKLDRQVVERALQRGDLAKNNDARLQFLQGAASILQEVSVWTAYLQCLKETRSNSLLPTFEKIADWIDFEEISPTQLLRFINFFWEAFQGPTRLSLFFRFMGKQSFRQATVLAVRESENVSREIKSHWEAYQSLWAKNPKEVQNRNDTTEHCRSWLAADRREPDTIPKATKLKIGTWLLAYSPNDFREEPLWKQFFQLYRSTSNAEGLFQLGELALGHTHYEWAQRAFKSITERQKPFSQAQVLLRMLGRDRVGPFAVAKPALTKSGQGPAFWLTKQQHVYLRVMPLSHGPAVEKSLEAQRQLLGVFETVSNRGFDQGVLCVASVLVGRCLPDFLLQERRLNLPDVLSVWLQGVRFLAQLHTNHLAIQPFNAADWYVDGRSGGTRLQLSHLDHDADRMQAPAQTLAEMNRYFSGALQTHFSHAPLATVCQQEPWDEFDWLTCISTLQHHYRQVLGSKERGQFHDRKR